MTREALSSMVAAATALVLAAGCGDDGAGEPPATILTGCPDVPGQPIAPGGYYVDGNTICTGAGQAHLFHGVDRPTLEWTTTGLQLSISDFQQMAAWNANVVRIALNQDFWLAASPLYDVAYAGRVDEAIGWAEGAGMDVILDLHWSDRGVLGSCADACQQRMADINSLTFWSEVAARYKGDGRVLFELYNEPHNVTWPVWKSGGLTVDDYEAVGMQQLYAAVRATGAHNLVIVGGLDWAYDLSGVPDNRIDGYNILYATHLYGDSSRRGPERWDEFWGFLSKTDPVIVTEFGDLSTACSGDFSATVIAAADRHAASWTAWGWYPGGCTFPALIADWDGTPSASGVVVRDALRGYGDGPATAH